MQLTGPGVWASPTTEERRSARSVVPHSSASHSSAKPTPTNAPSRTLFSAKPFTVLLALLPLKFNCNNLGPRGTDRVKAASHAPFRFAESRKRWEVEAPSSSHRDERPGSDVGRGAQDTLLTFRAFAIDRARAIR